MRKTIATIAAIAAAATLTIATTAPAHAGVKWVCTRVC